MKEKENKVVFRAQDRIAGGVAVIGGAVMTVSESSEGKAVGAGLLMAGFAYPFLEYLIKNYQEQRKTFRDNQ